MSRVKKPSENLSIETQNQNILNKIHHRHSLSNPNSRSPLSNSQQQSKIKFSNILTNKHQSLNRESSPYAQSQSITKTYSISNIHKKKEKTRIKMKSASTLSSNNSSAVLSKPTLKPIRNENPLETTFPNFSFYDDWKEKNRGKHASADMNLSVTNCINLVDQSKDQDSKDPLREYARQNEEAQGLEFKLTKLLREKSTKSATSKMQKEVFDVYSKIFEETISKDKLFGPLLLKIQHAYEDWIEAANNDFKEASNNLKFELSELSKKCQQQGEDKKTMDRKIEKLSKENYELSKTLEEQEARYTDLQDKFFKIANIKLDQVPQDDSTWKYLIAENQNYANVCEKMRSELKSFAYKEKKLLKLILAMKKRGYPVEEIYEQEVRSHSKKKKDYEYNESDECPDDTENEQLVSGRPKPVEKPGGIPSLNLKEIKQDTPYSSSSSSSYYSDSESRFMKTQ